MQLWICLASSSIAATPAKFNWSYLQAAYQIWSSPCNCWCTASEECKWFSVAKSENPAQCVHRKHMVQRCQLDRGNVTLISTRDRMILIVAHVLALAETTVSAGVHRCEHSSTKLTIQTPDQADHRSNRDFQKWSVTCRVQQA